VARIANGSMRDALSLLDRLVAAGADGRVTVRLLEEVLGVPDAAAVAGVVSAIGSGDAQAALERAGALLEGGTSIEQAVELLADRFRTLMVAAVCGESTPLLELADEARAEAVRDARAFDPATLAHLVAVTDAVLRSVKQSAVPRTIFDAAVVRMALASRFVPTAEAAGGGEPPAKKALRPA
jgi:DNA polymerase-3 subunit gamma/tau